MVVYLDNMLDLGLRVCACYAHTGKSNTPIVFAPANPSLSGACREVSLLTQRVQSFTERTQGFTEHSEISPHLPYMANGQQPAEIASPL